MLEFTGTGRQARTVIFSAGMPGWYDFRVYCSRLDLNGGSGLCMRFFLDEVEFALCGAARPEYPPARLPSSLWLALQQPSFQASRQLRMTAGATVEFSIEAGADPQPDWGFEFSSQRLGDEF